MHRGAGEYPEPLYCGAGLGKIRVGFDIYMGNGEIALPFCARLIVE